MSVPCHIGRPDEGYDDDPYADFLPPICTDEEYKAEISRAVVIVANEFGRKDGQQYVDALLTIPGSEFEIIPFQELIGRLMPKICII